MSSSVICSLVAILQPFDFRRDDRTSSSFTFKPRATSTRLVGVFGSATGLPTAPRLCSGSPLTFTGEDENERFTLAVTLSLGSICVAFPLEAVLTCGCGGDGLGDEPDDSDPLDEVDVGDEDRRRFCGDFCAGAKPIWL